MKSKHFNVLLLALVGCGASQAEVFRCPGNVYMNNAAEARAKGCRLVEGGNITIVEGTRANTRPAATPAAPAAAAPASSGNTRVATAPPTSARVDSAEQRARDADARAILEAELRKAQARQTALRTEYNNGEPDKQGPEHRNHQKYLDRVAELKANIARNENDIAGLQRELSRLGVTPPAAR